MFYGVGMSTVTIAYTNHLPETLPQTEHVMRQNHTVILEEPPHPLFHDTLSGLVDIEDYLMEAEYESPGFSRLQTRLMQQLHGSGLEIIQVEPYLERLFQIQTFFADGNRPDQLEPGSVDQQVYRCEHEATGHLLNYYQAARDGTFEDIISAMQTFAKADAARFRLRDILRAKAIRQNIARGKRIYIEAGPMHLLLSREMMARLPTGQHDLRVWFPDPPVMPEYRLKTRVYSPGDILTMRYIFGHSVSADQAELLCGRALVFNQTAVSEGAHETGYDPHDLRQQETILDMLDQLSISDCRTLFTATREMSRTSAIQHAADYCRVSLH